MADQAHEWTDDQIDALAGRFAKAYGTAEREMRKKLRDQMEKFERDNAEWRERVRTGESTSAEYDEWLEVMARDRAFVGGLADTLARDASNANKKAMDAINDTIPEVYAENANYAAYGVETGLGYDTHSFDLVDESTVRRLISEQPDLLPPLPEPKVDGKRDIRWNRQKFTSAITQSILQGESVPNTAKRIERVMGMNQRAAVRAARTALTGAENAGRVESYRRAERMGIKLEQQWMATLDERTRIEHRLLDKQHRPVGERFEPFGYGPKYSIGFPGDPTALGAMVYNCRCTLVAWFPDIEKQDPSRWSRLPEGMTYDQWKAGKKVEKDRKESNGIVDGKDILRTWSRRSDQFDFEIEDVLAAQGFDGLPRVVSAEEFDVAVKAANDGDGLIMQRTYSATTPEVLDAYREQLYSGKWYVDCSTGGSQYGQGMYCAADYSGVLSQGIKDEMEHYIGLGQARAVPQVMRSKASEIAGLVDGATAENVEAFLKFRVDGDGSAFGKIPFDKLKKLNDAYSSVEAEVKASGAGFNYVETMTLDPSAKIITWRDAMNLNDELWEPGMPGDLGSFVAAMGYDAINAEGHGESGSYTVVLNRTKLIIKESE